MRKSADNQRNAEGLTGEGGDLLEGQRAKSGKSCRQKIFFIG